MCSSKRQTFSFLKMVAVSLNRTWSLFWVLASKPFVRFWFWRTIFLSSGAAKQIFPQFLSLMSLTIAILSIVNVYKVFLLITHLVKRITVVCRSGGVRDVHREVAVTLAPVYLHPCNLDYPVHGAGPRTHHHPHKDLRLSQRASHLPTQAVRLQER